MPTFNQALYKTIGERIQGHRKSKGLRQYQLSERIEGLGRASISNIEKGIQQTPIHTLYLICNELDIDIQALLPTYMELIQLSDSDSSSELKKQIEMKDVNEKTGNYLRNLIATKKTL